MDEKDKRKSYEEHDEWLSSEHVLDTKRGDSDGDGVVDKE